MQPRVGKLKPNAYTEDLQIEQISEYNTGMSSAIGVATQKIKPFLKWAGGKTQLLPELCKYVPTSYNRYIEPFLGGGAFFFNLRPQNAVLSDSNADLINGYLIVRDRLDELIKALRKFNNSEEEYYKVRDEWRPDNLDPIVRAARMIYLNKTGYNGLYRVNKDGKFNVPFGKRRNPTICDESTLRAASSALQGVDLVCDDYRSVLQKKATKGDFIYLDPPYHPLGGHSDFKRYTKEFFYASDHRELKETTEWLLEKGCYVLLTNSNTKFVRDLFEDLEYRAVNTRRNISSKASTRTGQDLIVFGKPPSAEQRIEAPAPLFGARLLEHFPGTRYMGSKYRVLPFIAQSLADLKFESVFDAFSGSGCVSYMFKQYGKMVTSNDFLHFAYYVSKSNIENSATQLSSADLEMLLKPNPQAGTFVQDKFGGLYFSDDENRFLDSLRANIEHLASYKKAIALAAISRACLKKRARGVFTFVGERYNDGRRDMALALQQHFIQNVEAFNAAVFDNGRENRAFNYDIFDLDVSTDLVYFDPPYFTPNSDNDYTRRYHFVEGYVRNWEGLVIQEHTATKKFKSYSTPFMSKQGAYEAFPKLFERFKKSIIVVSYSSNGLPNKSELLAMLKEQKKHVRIHECDLMYSFGNQGHRVGNNANRVKEYLFVGY